MTLNPFGMEGIREKLGIGLIIFALALASISFLFIDRYDDKRSFFANVMRGAGYTIWTDCTERNQFDFPPQCRRLWLPYRWILVTAAGFFFTGL
jgi:hypothetical protein